MIEILRFHATANPWQGVYQCYTKDVFRAQVRAAPWNLYCQQPEPYEDGFKKFSRSHYCGFKDMRQLKQWFPFYQHPIDHPDLTLSVFRVRAANHLTYQSVFLKEDFIDAVPFEPADRANRIDINPVQI